MKFVKVNGNPWGKQLPDCMIRVPSLALNMSYPYVCKLYKIACEDGRGIIIDEKITLSKFFDAFGDYVDEYDFSGFTSSDNTISYPSVEQWCEEHKNTGKYLLGLKHSKDLDFLGTHHATYVDTDKQILYDKFNCKDMIVLGFARFKPDKILSNKDKNSRFQHIFRKKLKENFSI